MLWEFSALCGRKQENIIEHGTGSVESNFSRVILR